MLINFEDLTFQIMSVFRAEHISGRFSVAERPYAALSLRIKGSGRIDIAGERLVSNPGDILYIPAGMPYEAEYTVNEMIVVHLVSCNYPTPELITSPNPAHTEAMFMRMLEGWETRRSSNYVKSEIYALFDHLLSESDLGDAGPALLASVEYMDEHFADPTLNIEAVCKATYLCRSTIQRRFRRHFGISPQQYLMKLRLEHAISLLAVEKLPVGEVAALSGFSDEKYFSRAFKKRYGFSPSKAIKNMLV